MVILTLKITYEKRGRWFYVSLKRRNSTIFFSLGLMYACVSFIEKYYKKKYLATKGVPSIFLNFTVLNGGYQKLEKSYTLKSKASRLKTFGSGRKFSIGDIKSIRLMGNDIIVPMGLPYNDSWSKVSTIIDFKLGSLRAILSTWF